MIGIYKITNLLSGETYIGQSTDIEQRFREHIYHSESYVDEKIHEIGVENFGFEVVELCEQNQLDLREDYYINFYKSNVPGYGYNIVRGGQHNIGESNSNVKLTEKDVYNIREAYNNHERKYDVYERFKHKVTSSYFFISSPVLSIKVSADITPTVFPVESNKFFPSTCMVINSIPSI